MSLVSESLVDEIASACLNHLVSEPDLLGQFMAETGISANEIRSGMNNQIKVGLFDYFAHNEPAMLAMCANAQLSSEQFMRAYYKLNPGG